jgi:hypothetical protein
MIMRWIILVLVLVQVGGAAVLEKVLQLPKPPAASNYTEEMWLYLKESIVDPIHVFYQQGRSEVLMTPSGCQLLATLTNTTVIQTNISAITPKTRRWLHLATVFSSGETSMYCTLLINGFKVPCETIPPKELFPVSLI